ncbi:MAG: hypothetical protein HQ513_07145 [Rhodospirillales bacterium]|nr:hypothetical protein [Rhodospirillales bacterium]
MIYTLTNMPVLAIVLIVFLVWIGVRAIAPRTVRFRQLYILPSTFMVISANQIFNSYNVSLGGFLAWSAATVVAGGISLWIAERTPINFDRLAGTIDLPGTWVTLSLILIFIAARIYFGRQLYVTPELRTDVSFTAKIVTMTGLVTGYYLGRSGSFLIRYFRAEV